MNCGKLAGKLDRSIRRTFVGLHEEAGVKLASPPFAYHALIPASGAGLMHIVNSETSDWPYRLEFNSCRGSIGL